MNEPSSNNNSSDKVAQFEEANRYLVVQKNPFDQSSFLSQLSSQNSFQLFKTFSKNQNGVNQVFNPESNVTTLNGVLLNGSSNDPSPLLNEQIVKSQEGPKEKIKPEIEIEKVREDKIGDVIHK